MRLKRLILQGFKSFADRTEFVFDSPITGIVGPNGCGKSNVVDGFKWVLGEQSAKSLRGEAMLDVIFNGSGGRKPAGMAEVVLVFDNPRRADGTRTLNVDFEEVSVGRRLYRDGTSEYQLNSSPSRLKDVRELFLDTGVGVDAYSVIEQGKVDLLLQSNPQERRLIFEEAAGISKYKAKKKESQRKLERVDQNLLRVRDIVEEVEKRLRSVKIQAGRARTYQEHTERLQELRLNYSLQEYHSLHAQQRDLESRVREGREQLEGGTAELERQRAAHGEARRQFEEAARRRQRNEYDRMQTSGALQQARQQQQYADQQIRQIDEQLAQFQQDRESAVARRAEAESSLAEEKESLLRFNEEVGVAQGQIERQRHEFADGQNQLNAISRQVEQLKSGILELMRQSAQVGNRLGAIEIERRNVAAQQSRLDERRTVISSDVQAAMDERREIEAAGAAVAAEIAALQAQMDAAAAEASALGQRIGRLAEQLSAAREHRSGLMSRQKLLEDLDARREGVSEGVKTVLRQRAERFPFIRGLVADLLRVDVEHAQVIEAALDGRDQMLVASDFGAVLSARQHLEELDGRVSILCMDRLIEAGSGGSTVLPCAGCGLADDYPWNRHPQLIRKAIDLVRFEPEDTPVARYLLGRTIVADCLDDAVQLSREGPFGFRYVTGAGEVVEADGTIRMGPISALMGLLSRRSEMQVLKSQIADVDRRVEQLAAEVAEGNAEAAALQQKQASIRHSIYQANTRKVEVSGRLSRNQDRINSLQRELPVLDREMQQLAGQLEKLTGEESVLAEKREGLESAQAERQGQIDELSAQRTATEEHLRQAGEQLTSLRIQLGQVQEKQLSSQQSLRRLEAMVVELGQQIERIDRSAQQVEGRRDSAEAELESARAIEATQVEKLAALEADVAVLAERAESLEALVANLEGEVERLDEEHGRIEQELHAVELHVGQLRVRLESLVQRTMEELQLDLPARYAQIESAGGYQPSEMDWDAVAAEIKALRERIQRLGNVNLDAITEQQELEQRQTFLATQVTDLVDSKRQLEELIETINQESRVRFEQTFNTVREHFQGMFRKLFGGGKADIYLETELEVRTPAAADGETPAAPARRIDILDAGIEIIARPPGKQPVSISQLSGGEKTMTCVALLMSIFKSKPSPFCILDEVDAALDEANNQRFNLIVQEFLDQSQFIVITHSKRTMQIADVLYGVTMQEQGVSKRVAVRFDQVDGQGRINEHAAA